MTEAIFPPQGSCDCHVHVIGPKSHFPLAPAPSYVPVDAPVDALRAMLDRLGLARTVIVQPSIYGTDNSCLVDALHQLGDRARGVAVVDSDCPGSELDRLHHAGVRGLRVNLISSGRSTIDDARQKLAIAARSCARNGWHVQIFIEPNLLDHLLQDILALPIQAVIDHFGMTRVDGPTAHPGEALTRLLGSGRGWVKLSAPYRIAEDVASSAVRQLAQILADHGSAVLWASDWPHTPPHHAAPSADTGEVPYRDLDTASLLGLVDQWLPDRRDQERLLVDNPARLYGWDNRAAI